MPPSMPTATSRALTTIEILESILFHLGPLPLLHAQRVHPLWRTLIRTSLPLRRALYLAPSTSRLLVPQEPPYTLPVVNPLITTAFRNHIDPHSRPMRWATAQGEHVIVFVVRVVNEEWEERFKYPEASWKGMLLSQPPVECASVMNLAGAWAGRGDAAGFEVRNAEGVRLGECVYPR